MGIELGVSNFEKFNLTIDECDIHASRLKMAYLNLILLFPIDKNEALSFSDLQNSFVDQLMYRFSSLRHTMESKLFLLLVGAFVEDCSQMTIIDILNRLEKAELLPSARKWREIGEFCDHLTHEYPDNPALMVKNLNSAPKYVKELLDYWDTMRVRAIQIKDQLQK